MSAIEVLMGEHRLIERALHAVENYADLLDQSTGGASEQDLGAFVAFIKQYADARHHGKEEEILFRAMVKAGFPLESGPLAVMLRDHEEGRRFVRIMSEASGKSGWSGSEARVVAEAARGYAVLLRNHIWKEDNMLYVMAQRQMSPEEMAEVTSACERFDAERDARGEDDALVEAAKVLFNKYIEKN